jgi:prepilin-type N-terminal cleavage/methylation domain-containing protein
VICRVDLVARPRLTFTDVQNPLIGGTPRLVRRVHTGSSMRSRRGYTVLELMTAIAIIGILARTALQIYTAQTMRTKRVEAMEALNAVFEAEVAYYAQNARYADTFDKLDFKLEGGKQLSTTSYQGNRYVFQLSQPLGSNSFYCIGTANLDGDDWPDILETYDYGDNT